MKQTMMGLGAALLVALAMASPASAWVRVKNCDKEPRTFYAVVATEKTKHTLPVGGSFVTYGYPVEVGMDETQLQRTYSGNEYCIWDNKMRIQRAWRNIWSN